MTTSFLLSVIAVLPDLLVFGMAARSADIDSTLRSKDAERGVGFGTFESEGQSIASRALIALWDLPLRLLKHLYTFSKGFDFFREADNLFPNRQLFEQF